MTRRLRLGAGLLAASLVAGSCSLGEKEAITDRVLRAATSGPTVAVTVELAVSVEKSPAQGLGSVSAGLEGAGLGPVTWTGTYDADSGRSSLLAPADAAARLVALGEEPGAPLALAVIEPRSVVVRRPAGEVVAARPWYRLDTTAEVREVTKPDMSTVLTGRSISDAAILNPTMVVSFLHGTLPGSVEMDGQTITGRISLEKAARENDLDDDEVETRERAMQIYAITRDVHDFTLTTADDGSIDRLVFDFASTPNKQTRLLITWTMDVTGPADDIASPADDLLIDISSYAQARGAIDEWTGRA